VFIVGKDKIMGNKFPDYDGAFQPVEYQSLGERGQLVQDSRGHWLWRSETSGDDFSAIGYLTIFSALAAHARYLARRQGTPPPEKPGARYQAPASDHGESYNMEAQKHG
jgi:hypothetical protein